MKRFLVSMLWPLKQLASNYFDLLMCWMPCKLRSIGQRSYIPFPRRIVGGNKIKIGDRADIGRNAYMVAIQSHLAQRFDPWIVIGNDVYIGPNCYFSAINRIEIQDGVVIRAR